MVLIFVSDFGGFRVIFPVFWGLVVLVSFFFGVSWSFALLSHSVASLSLAPPPAHTQVVTSDNRRSNSMTQ